MSRSVRPSSLLAGSPTRARQKSRACLEALENRVLLSSTLLTNGTGESGSRVSMFSAEGQRDRE